MTNAPDARRHPQFTMGDRLRKAREQRGYYDRQEFAKVIGIHRDSLAKYETDKQPPKRPVIIAWAMATDVDVHWILGDDGPDGGNSQETHEKITFALPRGGSNVTSIRALRVAA